MRGQRQSIARFIAVRSPSRLRPLRPVRIYTQERTHVCFFLSKKDKNLWQISMTIVQDMGRSCSCARISSQERTALSYLSGYRFAASAPRYPVHWEMASIKSGTRIAISRVL